MAFVTVPITPTQTENLDTRIARQTLAKTSREETRT